MYVVHSSLVERAEAPYGIVYGTDAKVSKEVKTVGVFRKTVINR